MTGMGGELGTAVAQMLELVPEIDEIAGVDFLPPRRRLRRSSFHRIDPRDGDRLAAFVAEFAPDGLVHLGVYEPHARMGPASAEERTEAATAAAIGAAARSGALERLVVRSGISVYGRGRGRPGVPDEDVPVAPTSPYGRICLDVEAVATRIGHRLGIPVCALRMASVVASHVPSPLGRLLRLPVVPVPACADPAFGLVDARDAAGAMVQALLRGYDGPLNLVGPGAATPWQAVRAGNRIPFPVLGPGWAVARRMAEVAGAPLPLHVEEVLRRGGIADGSRAVDALGLTGLATSQEVLTDLYEWATVTPLRPAEAA